MVGLNIVKNDKTEITKEDIINKIPSKKRTVTDEVVRLINEANNDPMFNGNEFFNTLVDYQSAMLESKASIKEFIDAVKFCAHLESGKTLTEAYINARRNDRYVQERMDFPKDSPEYKAITSAASRYKKSKVVRQLLLQADMPLYLMFQGDRYKAVAVLAREMQSAQYSRDRIAAADKLLTHVKPPENIQIEMDIGVNESSAIEDLNAQLAQLASRQMTHLEAGTMELKDMGAMKPKSEDVLDVEVE